MSAYQDRRDRSTSRRDQSSSRLGKFVGQPCLGPCLSELSVRIAPHLSFYTFAVCSICPHCFGPPPRIHRHRGVTVLILDSPRAPLQTADWTSRPSSTPPARTATGHGTATGIARTATARTGTSGATALAPAPAPAPALALALATAVAHHQPSRRAVPRSRDPPPPSRTASSLSTSSSSAATTPPG